jgi:hypothetical protein
MTASTRTAWRPARPRSTPYAGLPNLKRLAHARGTSVAALAHAIGYAPKSLWNIAGGWAPCTEFVQHQLCQRLACTLPELTARPGGRPVSPQKGGPTAPPAP